MRRLGHKQSAPDHSDGARHEQPFDEHGAFIHPSITILIFEQTHPADWLVFAFAIDIRHESAHLQDVHPPVSIELDLDWRFDHRVAGHRLDAKAWLKAEAL